MFEILRRIAKQGHDVHMVTSLYPGAPAHELVDGISVMRMRPGVRPIRMLRNYLAYRRFFAGRVDVVVEEAEGPQGPFFLKLFVKEPIALLWYQLGRKIFLGQFGPLIGRILYLLDYVYGRLYRSNLIVVLTDSNAQEISSVCPNARTLVVHPALPDQKFPLSLPDKGPMRRCDGLYLLTINKFRRYKAFDHAVRAFGMVATEFPTLKMVVGGVTEDEKYERELFDLGNKLAPGRVLIFPDLSVAEKNELLKGAYAFVLPSPVEGFSIATLEALSHGTPAIVTEGVPDDLVVDGRNGLKYHFGDVLKLASLYRFLLTKPDVRAQMSLQAKETAEKFNWTSSTEDLLRSFEHVVVDFREGRKLGP